MAFFVTLVAVATVRGQNTKVTNAAIEYDAGMQNQDLKSFENAIKEATAALAKPELLKPNQLAKAYAVRGRSYLEVFALAYAKDDKALLEKYESSRLDAYDDLEKALELDQKTWYDQLKIYRVKLSQYLLLDVQKFYQADNFSKALETITKVERIFKDLGQPPTYNIYSFRGTIFLAKKTPSDSLAALKDLQESLKVFDETVAKTEKLVAEKKLTKEQADELKKDNTIPKIYATLITLYSTVGKDPMKATQLADEGKKRYPGDEDIVKAELEVYRNHPNLFNEAVKKFEEQIQKNPKDVPAILAFANVYEQASDRAGEDSPQYKEYLDKATKLYEQALAIEPNNQLANFNLGAIYNNMAAAVSNKQNKLDYKQAAENERLQKEKIGYLEKALPYMEKAHNADPRNEKALRTLVQIVLNLNLTDKYNLYNERLQNLQK